MVVVVFIVFMNIYACTVSDRYSSVHGKASIVS